MAGSKLLRISFLLFAGGLIRAATPSENQQWWSEADLVGPVAKNTTATILATSRMGDALPNPSLWGGGLVLDYAAGHWTVSAGDLFVDLRNGTSGQRTSVNLPLVALTYSFKVGGTAISDRNRWEQLEGISGTPSRYRNQLLVDRPVLHLGPVSHVFISDEVFSDLKDEYWSRNRAKAGVGIPLGRSVQLLVFYLREDDRFKALRTLHVLGTTMVIGW